MQPGGLKEQAIASLLAVATAASLSPVVRLAALASFADGQALPAALGGEAEEAVLWLLQLAAVAALAAAAAAAAHTAAGTNAARAQEVAVSAVWSAACRVLRPKWASHYSREVLAAAAAASGGDSGGGTGRPHAPSVWQHLVALHTRLQASGCSTHVGLLLCLQLDDTQLRLPPHSAVESAPLQAALPALASVGLPTCCAILELLFSEGSPYRSVLSRGGRLMAGGCAMARRGSSVGTLRRPSPFAGVVLDDL